MAEFVMPTLGADMTAATLLGWIKKPGDEVKRGDIIAEVDTDKGVIEVEVFTSGVIEKLLVEPGAEVPVGTALAIIREELEEGGRDSIETPSPKIQPAVPVVPVPPVSPKLVPNAVPAAPRLRASPAAKKLAAGMGIDLGTVTGTGPGGRIQRQDVERAAARSYDESRD